MTTLPITRLYFFHIVFGIPYFIRIRGNAFAETKQLPVIARPFIRFLLRSTYNRAHYLVLVANSLTGSVDKFSNKAITIYNHCEPEKNQKAVLLRHPKIVIKTNF